MADRYWVGGTGTWDTTSTTNWSASSGGASGASVPTSADDVFFNQASTYTVTCTGALTCRTLTVSAGTVTFAQGTNPTFAIAGGLSLVAGTVWSATGAFTFTATSGSYTITTNGVVINATNFQTGSTSGTVATWTLGSSLTLNTSTSTLGVAGGTFNTNNYNVTVWWFSSNNSNVRTINLGSSTFTTTGAFTNIYFNLANITNLTFNAGTSTIICQSSNGTFASGGLTFYNVNLTSTTSNTHTITGINTFQALTITGPAAAGVTQVIVSGRQTFNGALGTTGTAGNRRVFFTTATYGISYDFVVNATPSLTDADFRGIYVRGTSAPISGTRIGNRGECRGITFDTPKTVYWNLAAGGNWSANAWALSSGGAVSTDNFPLPQDTATIVNTGLTTGNAITLDAAVTYIGSIDLSGRTNNFIFQGTTGYTVHGNWTNGSGVSLSISGTGLTFSGGTTQTITSAGKTFTCPITVDTYGGTVQLADALNTGGNLLTITNGTFDTKGYSVVTGAINSNNSNIRSIYLNASTITLNTTVGLNFFTSTNLTLNAGTSQINLTSSASTQIATGFNAPIGLTFYNVSFTSANNGVFHTISGVNTFNNLTFTPASSLFMGCSFSANQTINGTLTCAGASAVRRIFLRSDTIGTQRTLTVNSISATDCDFRDINLAGTASGASPTRAGNCGGNSGITFPGAKTVYWNLAGAQNWSATGWATGSGGSPAVNNFPLAQDTAVFDNTGSVTGTITIDAAWNIGTFDASARTSAMTLTTLTNSPVVYGDWKFGTGVTSSATSGTITFAKNGTQTITSNGVQFNCPVTVNHPSGTVQLADAFLLTSGRFLTLTAGTFDALTYNVTVGGFFNSASSNILRMGSATWTLSGNSQVWNCSTAPITVAGTSTIVLSDATNNVIRTFSAGSGQYFNKITIGGGAATGTTTSIANTGFVIGELASTKTVAFTITFTANAVVTIGKWSVTGTVGNVVSVNTSIGATAFTLSIAGPANSGINYLSVRDCTVDTASPGEFYVGANSTNVSGNTRVIFTATPAARTLYWVGGTGNWSSTTKWSTSSGGGSGAAIPTSLDAVVFDSASNATAYTATIDAGVTLARCASFTMAGPLSGDVTFAGSVGIAFHGNVSFAATGITRTYTGAMQWAGNSSYTFDTGGNIFSGSPITIIGINSTWTLANTIFIAGNIFTITYGSFSTSASNYAMTIGRLNSANSNVRSISLNGSTITSTALGGTNTIALSITTNLTFDSGTSSFSLQNAQAGIASTGLTFYNVSFTSAAATDITITGANTFNTLSFAGRTTVGITPVTFSANQTITTLTLNAGTAAAYRTFLASDTIGTQRTLTVTTLTGGAADYDFRDIAIAGAAAPISGTRFGDCKGNSGITFPAAKTVYWRLPGSFDWGTSGSGGWSATSGGALDATQFPLAQDTAIFPAATYPASGATTTVNANYNIGTIDMSLRTTNTMTLATGTTNPTIYGNWINGTGTTLTGTTQIVFAGRNVQTLTSVGKTFTQNLGVTSPGGSLTLQDAFNSSSNLAFGINQGTFDANGYSFTLSGSGGVQTNTLFTRSIAFGSGTWTIAGTGGWVTSNPSFLTVTGTGTISFTSASAKSFQGGGLSYTNITLNQGGAGALTISGNNTFKDITNTYSATGATTIALGNTTQTVTQFTGTGAVGKVLTISGTSAGSPGTLIMSGAAKATASDYLTISNVRAYNLFDTWYAGNNSTNSGSLGWYFQSGIISQFNSNFFVFFS